MWKLALLKVLNTLPPFLSFVLVQRKIRTRLVSTAGAVMTGLFFFKQRTTFRWCEQLEPTASFLCPQSDGDRITNYSSTGDGHRITDYKVNRPIKLAITRILVLEYRYRRHHTKVLE